MSHAYLRRIVSASVAIIFTSSWLCACDKPSAPDTAAKSTTKPDSVASAIARSSTAAQSDCLPRMKRFLRWYLASVEQPDTSTRFINFPVTAWTDSAFRAAMPRSNVSSTAFYQLNRKKLTTYLDTLKKSGYFSNSFLLKEGASILKRGAELDAAKMNDGVFSGFAGDEVFWTQELYDAQDIDKLVPYVSSKLKNGTFAYRLPSQAAQINFFLFLKIENGLCVLDSAKHGIN